MRSKVSIDTQQVLETVGTMVSALTTQQVNIGKWSWNNVDTGDFVK